MEQLCFGYRSTGTWKMRTLEAIQSSLPITWRKSTILIRKHHICNDTVLFVIHRFTCINRIDHMLISKYTISQQKFHGLHQSPSEETPPFNKKPFSTFLELGLNLQTLMWIRNMMLQLVLYTISSSATSNAGLQRHLKSLPIPCQIRKRMGKREQWRLMCRVYVKINY